jgi:N-acetylmuramoyl-L-alanine amidase
LRRCVRSPPSRRRARRGRGRALDPARFEPGLRGLRADIARPRHTTVFIDAGHGGPDPGAVGVTLAGRPVHEATETLRVALDALPLLRAAGLPRGALAHERRGGRPPRARRPRGRRLHRPGRHRDLIARDVCANRARANILIGVYFNASDYTSDGGSLTLFDAARPFWRSSLRLAQLVQHERARAPDAHGLASPTTASTPTSATAPPSPARTKPTATC